MHEKAKTTRNGSVLETERRSMHRHRDVARSRRRLADPRDRRAAARAAAANPAAAPAAALAADGRLPNGAAGRSAASLPTVTPLWGHSSYPDRHLPKAFTSCGGLDTLRAYNARACLLGGG
jgi:hypothetical protein